MGFRSRTTLHKKVRQIRMMLRADGSRWVQGAYHRDDKSCLIGAVRWVCDDYEQQFQLTEELYGYLIQDIKPCECGACEEHTHYEHCLVDWNDETGRTWAEVDALLDRAERATAPPLDEQMVPKATSDVHNAQLVG
jgi:hypothetical protein